MQDVAKLARVATMTVSRVINGNEHGSEETRQRVLNAIKTLNYRPNTLARSLREERSRQIGVIIPNLQDPFFAVCAQAAGMVATKHAYSINIAMSGEDPEVEYNEAILMLQRHVEGLIVIPSAGSMTRLTEPEFFGLPIVTLDRPVEGTPFDSVVVNNSEGAALAVEHLIQHGHRRIAFVGLSLDLYTMRKRHEGYCRAMDQAQLDTEVHCKPFTQPEIIEMLKALMTGPEPVTAIFSGNNLTSRNVLHGLATLGVKVPSQIAVVGFDDFETADLLNPAFTVISQPVVEMGRSGAELLFSKLAHKHRSSVGEHLVLPVELIVRNSCGRHNDAPAL